MFYTGLDPYTMEEVYVPKTVEEKKIQRTLLQYFKPENRQRVLAALRAAGRHDLIGTGPDCLVKPDRTAAAPTTPAKRHPLRNVHKKKRK